jgi:cytidylate kinase
MGTPVVIAIDGPAASGKSSVAVALARRLGWRYVNTGAMYRAITWLVLERGLKCDDAGRIRELLRSTKFECRFSGDECTLFIDGADPAAHLTDAAVTANVSSIASIPDVRRLLVEMQRACAADRDTVMEGRDIGSVVFPGTPFKFYIDASLEVRAARRAKQGLTDRIVARDRQDSSRPMSPLVIAEDAHVVDSSHLTIDGVVGEIIGRLKLKGLALPEKV